MFTVKVRDSEIIGSEERLYSAETIKVIWPGPNRDPALAVAGATNWDKAGIYLNPREEWQAATEVVQEHMQLFADNIILFGGDHTNAAEKRKGGKVWVMNEHGATVATYDL